MRRDASFLLNRDAYMRHQNVVVFGGAGFIGGHLVAELAAAGRRVTVVTRRVINGRKLILLPTVEVVEANPLDSKALVAVLDGQDAAINLVGVLHSTHGVPYGPAFARAHVELPQAIARACGHAGVKRILHMSALGANPSAPSMYLRSKADGERAVFEQRVSAVTVFRPSVVFGEDDHFVNLFASLQRWFPVIPLARPNARFQPVYVGDVAHAMANALDAVDAYGKVYELVGPSIYTLRELVRLAGLASRHARPIVALPDWIGRCQAQVMEWLPGPTLMSRDNFDSMRVDSIASARVAGLEAPELGAIDPTPLEQVLLEHLGVVHARSHFDAFRAQARR
jgi:uncharacterized protein YbjT (DUF2867 family)